LVLEAMAYEKKTLVELQKELHEFVGCSFINTRVDKKLESVDEVKPTLDKFSALDDVAGMKVIRKDFKDGVKLYLEDEKTWILVRPSGTEPLLRIYIESDSQEKINNIKSLQGLS
jgi:phosphomannomutase